MSFRSWWEKQAASAGGSSLCFRNPLLPSPLWLIQHVWRNCLQNKSEQWGLVPGPQEDDELCKCEPSEPGVPVPRDCTGRLWCLGTQLCTSGVHRCHLPPWGASGAQPRGTISPGSGAVELHSGLDCFCRRAAGWVCAGLSLFVLPHTEHLSPAPLEPPHHLLFCLQSLLTPHHAFCPGDIWLLLTLNECLAFRGFQGLISWGRSAAHQYSGRKSTFPFSHSHSLGALWICFCYKLFGKCVYRETNSPLDGHRTVAPLSPRVPRCNYFEV